MSRAQEIQELIAESPLLVLRLRRDGTLLGHAGGRALSRLIPDDESCGRRIDELWPESIARILTQLCRKAIASRASVDGRINVEGVDYEVRATATSPDRVNCIIRPGASGSVQHEQTGGFSKAMSAGVDRRRYLEQLQEAVVAAILKEAPAALILFTLGGLEEIAEIDEGLAHTVVARVLMRFGGTVLSDQWRPASIGPVNAGQLAVVVETANRAAIEAYVCELRQSMQEPVHIGADTWHLVVHAGVSLLGRDANSARELLDQARIAAGEARRMDTPRAQFFSDTIRFKSLARLDMAQELRTAISSHEVGMRYRARHELASGRLQALLGYVTWRHPLRGDMTPKEYLSVAQVSGTSIDLSREMLRALGRDIERFHGQFDASVCFSYGPLRHHLMHEHFMRDLEEFLKVCPLPASRIEVRVTERCFVALRPQVFTELQKLGVKTIVDEVGRSLGSLAKLAALPLWGMQLDRTLVKDARSNATALRLCRAAFGAAKALGLSAIAAGADDEPTRTLLLECSCGYGSGDLFEGPSLAESRARFEQKLVQR